MRPLLLLLFSIVGAWLSASGTAGAAEAWRATQVAGEVRVEFSGAQAVPLTIEMAIAGEASIETAASGSATLVRGEERVVIAPNSRLRLPVQSTDGFTRIIEEFGSLFFRVGKKTAPHFRVETPLLAATVKGTAFTVTVDHKGANVEVKEGLVLVQNNASADETLVAPGRSASVILSQPQTLYLDRTIVPPTGMRLRLGSADERAALDLTDSAQPEQARASAGQGAAAALVIAMPKLSMKQSPAALVIDSTLTGVGFGIIAAALAIGFIGSNWRRPGLATAKAKRSSKADSK